MSVHVNAGKPGAGKSYHSVVSAIAAVKSGRAVITNLPLKMDHPFWVKAMADGLLAVVPPTTVDMGHTGEHLGSVEYWGPILDGAKDWQREIDLPNGEKDTIGPLIIVDECGSTFAAMMALKPPRDAMRDGPEKQVAQAHYDGVQRLIEFFRLHRHSRTDIILIVQAYQQMPAPIRDLVERWHEIVNMQEVHGVGSPYQVRTFVKGTQIGTKQHMEKTRGQFSKDVFEHYDSFAMGAGAGGGKIKSQAGMRKARPFWLRVPFILFVVVVVLLFYLVPRLSSQIFGTINNSPASVVGSDKSSPPEPVTILSSAPTGVAGQVRNVSGLPPSDSAFLGFEGEYLYFEGFRLSQFGELSDLGWVVDDVTQCSVRLLSVDGNSITYNCKRGF